MKFSHIPGTGPRCSGPKCGKPIEQNHKVVTSPRDPYDTRHVRCAPEGWLNKAGLS